MERSFDSRLLEDVFDIIMNNDEYITRKGFVNLYCDIYGFEFTYDADENKIVAEKGNESYEITIKKVVKE